VPYVGPTFGRLEHYRIHEYARAAAGKSYGRGGAGKPGQVIDDSSIRRRGRPPKYPKIELPKIPKVELTDEEIRQSQSSQASPLLGNAKVINGFRMFTPDDPCPDERCSYVGKLHYHCARPRCFTITDRIDVLNLHAKDFHSFVHIMEGYEFFDRSVSCRRFHCTNNQINRHFHCTRPKCDYSFIRHSTMSQHEKKHMSSTSATGLSVAAGSGSEANEDPTSPLPLHTTPNAAAMIGAGISPITKLSIASIMPVSLVPGQSLPAMPMFWSQAATSQESSRPVDTDSSSVTNATKPSIVSPMSAFSAVTSSMISSLAASTIQALPATVNKLTSPEPGSVITSTGSPINLQSINGAIMQNANHLLNVLLKQGGLAQLPTPNWNEMKADMHYSLSQNCGRPFCKLKKKDHYHCFNCNQAFSDPARLRSHVSKHGVKLKKNDVVENASIAPKPVNLSAQSISPAKATIPTTITSQDMDPDEIECLKQNKDNLDAEEDDDDDDDDVKSSSLNLNPSTFSEMVFKAQEQNIMNSDVENSDLDDDGLGENSLKIDTGSELDVASDSNDVSVDISSRSGRKITKTKHEGFMNSGDINLSKQKQVNMPTKSPQKSTKSPKSPQTSGNSSLNKIVGSGSRGVRDDSVPDGYSRWRYNEECCYPKCAYKHSVTHFHCVREDCGYGFSDRSRLVQHTLRHERIDSITGGELQQYRINQDCEIPECEYKLKMSHFHCKRCSYCCTDSSKVLTHRKNHAKMDKVVSQGFTKCLAADDCRVSACPYARKQTHFHCLIAGCQTPVLGPAQMTAHKTKHDTDSAIGEH